MIQVFDLAFTSIDLTLVHQQVHRTLPRSIEYYHDQKVTPAIVLAKIYSSSASISPDFYLLSLSVNVEFINGRTEISETNRCPRLSSDVSPIRYHHMCSNNSNVLCFRDRIYLCVCADNRTRVECFRYDDQLDQCPHSHCRSGGRCLRGDHSRPNDFLCLCPHCQFTSQSFTFTLDQVFYSDLASQNKHKTMAFLILLSLLGFLLAIPNNLFSFVTFRRRFCLHNGIGYYLLCLSVINQINLGSFLARIIHIIINITTSRSPSIWNNILCKLLNYSLSTSSRMVYWLTSLIAIERVYMTLVVNGQWLKQPHIARRLIVFSIVSILITHVYELSFYDSFFDITVGQGSICIFEFPLVHRSRWMAFHQLIFVSNSLLPFLINLCSTITISAVVIKNKMNTLRTSPIDQENQSTWIILRDRLRLVLDVLNENKELVIGPGITLVPQFFSLPLFISAFVLTCHNIEQSWLRYLLIVCYWISLTPQATSFFLYISPSSSYSNEWRKTKISRWLKRDQPPATREMGLKSQH